MHCIKSKLYLAKWKWILRSGPKLKMLVKFHLYNGSFPNLLNWWRIRFGCTALDHCYWIEENWFANRRVGWPRAWYAAGEILLQLILYVHAHLDPPPPPPNIKETVMCTQGDSTACFPITKLRLWPLDHSSSVVQRERERLIHWSVRLENSIKTRNTACTQEICVILCKEIRQMRYWNSSGKVNT